MLERIFGKKKRAEVKERVTFIVMKETKVYCGECNKLAEVEYLSPIPPQGGKVKIRCLSCRTALVRNFWPDEVLYGPNEEESE